MNNLCSFIFETMPQVLLLLVKAWVRSCTFITVIGQIMTFFLNLDTSNKNFETTKYSLGRSFQKQLYIYIYKQTAIQNRARSFFIAINQRVLKGYFAWKQKYIYSKNIWKEKNRPQHLVCLLVGYRLRISEKTLLKIAIMLMQELIK